MPDESDAPFDDEEEPPAQGYSGWIFKRFLAQAGVAVAVFVAFLVVRSLVTIWQGTTTVAQITSVDGSRVCLTLADAGATTECLTAGTQTDQNGLTGQDPSWYSSRIGTCIQIRGTSGTPGGAVEKEVPCPSAPPPQTTPTSAAR